KISLYINRLSYLFVKLVSHEATQKHIFRVVPFVDGVLDVTQDVFITICFCKDNDEDYDLLLQDHQSKLRLGNYVTFQISRSMSEGSGGDSCELALSSQEDGYRLSKDKSSKYFDVDHLCSASRVSHQFRLMRCKGEVTEMVNVKLKISQSEENQTDLIL
ncbi:hypothetical protein, partial [Salmonella sp. S146_54837]|uniref:hypothetical protein n=1 Tax=Salmonella sp. S146_54837 TaxID=2665635 RepID=UPI001CA9D599